MVDTALLALGVLFVLIFALAKYKKGTEDIPLPPGPKARFLVGNIFDLPFEQPWRGFTDWRTIYGSDLTHFELFGKHTIIVNSKELANLLFEKRASIYSDRPYIAMVELLGWAEASSAFKSYGHEWRAHRRLLQKGFRYNASQAYQPTEKSKVQEFLSNLLHHPDDFMSHTRTLAAAVILAIVYGHDVAPTSDHFVEIAEKALATFAEATSPTGNVVNFFPSLRFLPGWLPGCGFQQRAAACRVLTKEMVNVPVDRVLSNMANGTAKPCLLVDLLEANKVNGGDTLQEEYIKRVAATAYGAGAETTASFLETFFLAMTLHPEVQAKAQEEIESVIGQGRLPTFEDRVNLPYVEAIYRESHRWSPVLPMGLPHCTVADDVVNGAITRDPVNYPDPESFIPERFLREDGTLNDDDVSVIFGFGA
ncbi:hypothetical protein VNI00_006010 [Paramarasmius palmivorus]|uniref:Cytochrome P450 n=1 Tax=Paramarasmius palmivorus TaxID=297713 RepID=A0AAW0DDZ1_9AGAR